jgi:hypothetical protein
MSARDCTLIADWEARLGSNALALRILGTLNDRKSEVERCALDGLQRENPQFSRAASPEFREEALGHCNEILQLMLAIAGTRVATPGPETFRFVETHARRRAPAVSAGRLAQRLSSGAQGLLGSDAQFGRGRHRR